MLNRVILMGRITADPELKTTNTGVSVTSFSIAVDRNYVKQGEERKATSLILYVGEVQRNLYAVTLERVLSLLLKDSSRAVSSRLRTVQTVTLLRLQQTMFRSQANAVTTMQAATISPMAAISHTVLRLTAETRLIIRNLLRSTCVLSERFKL